MTTKIKEFWVKLLFLQAEDLQIQILKSLLIINGKHQVLKKISYESIDITIEDTSVVKLDTEELKNFNKNGITLVTPNENTFFTYNYNQILHGILDVN